MGSSINLRCTEWMPREAELDSVDEQRRLGREFSTADTQNSEEETTAGWSSSESGITAIRFPSWTLDRNCHPTRAVWDYTGRWPWRFCCASSFGSVCSIRHGRPRNTPAALTYKLQHKRSSPPMVSVVPSPPNPTCPSWFNDIVSCSLGLRYSPELSDILINCRYKC